MHLLLCAEDSEAELRSQLAQSFPGALVQPGRAGLLETDFPVTVGQRLPHLVFARQWMPNARLARAESVRAWASELFDSISGVLPEDQPWSLHLEPHYGARTTHHIGARAWHSRSMRSAESGMRNAASTLRGPGPKGEGESVRSAEAGRHRCQLIREALIELMKRKRRHLLRQLRREPSAFTASESLVQVFLLAPEEGFISVSVAPVPFEQRHWLSPFAKGEVPVASDQTAPSRAFAKLVEAELRLGRAIQGGESCVDLGAAPGSWTYVAVGRGARVTAVDRSPLRVDLMRSRQVEFVPGDAFRFEPKQPVDWLLCDVLAAPERTAELLLQWLQRGWCRQFVVTLKLGDAPGTDVLGRLKRELPPLAHELFLSRLCANKKEVCAFGVRHPE